MINTVDSNTPRGPSPHSSTHLHGHGPIILLAFVNLTLCIILLHLLRRYLRCPPTLNIIESPKRQHSLFFDNLPLIVFSSVSRHRSVASDTAECTMCVTKFDDNDILRLLPLCCHAFHAECVDKWLGSNSICPLCRSSVLLSDSDLVEILQSPSENEGTNPSVAAEEHSISISVNEDIPTSEDSPPVHESEVSGREDWVNEIVEKLAATYLFDNGIRGERLDGFQVC